MVARAAAAQLPLDQVRLIPAAQQPFKAAGHHASAADRVAMLRAAVAQDPVLTVDAREIERGGRSYTVETLRGLRAEQPEDALFLLIGADAADDLPKWREAAAIPTLATVVALTRPGVAVPDHPLIDRLIAVPAVMVSATDVRARVARGESIAEFVPPAVAQYIADHRLYGEGV